MTEPELTQHSDHSSQPLRVTIPKLQQQLNAEEHSTSISAPPALLYRFQMNATQTRSDPPRKSKSMIQRMPGLKRERTNAPLCETLSQKHSDSLKCTPLIPKRPNVRSLMNRIVPSSQTRNGRTSLMGEPSTSMQYLVDNSPPHMITPKLRRLEILRSPSEQSNLKIG